MKQTSIIMGKTHVLPIPMKPVTSASEIERKIEKQKSANTATPTMSLDVFNKKDEIIDTNVHSSRFAKSNYFLFIL